MKKPNLCQFCGEFLRPEEEYCEQCEPVGKCSRCEALYPIDSLTKKNYELYCECCYDDMFVSWGGC